MIELKIAGLELEIEFEKVSADPKDLFSLNHQKYMATIHNRDYNYRMFGTFSYQCPKQEEPNAKDLVYCLLTEMYIAEDCPTFEDYKVFVGKEYFDSKEEYLKELNLFKQLQRNRKKIKGMFTEQQIKDLDKYFTNY